MSGEDSSSVPAFKLKVCTVGEEYVESHRQWGRGTEWEEKITTALPVELNGRRVIAPLTGRGAASQNWWAAKPKEVGSGAEWECSTPDVGKQRPVVLRRTLETVILRSVAYVLKYEVDYLIIIIWVDTRWGVFIETARNAEWTVVLLSVSHIPAKRRTTDTRFALPLQCC